MTAIGVGTPRHDDRSDAPAAASAPSPAAVELRGAAAGPAGAPVVAGVTWRVPAGGVGVIVGPSGSGKSRLLRLLNRLDEPAAGHVSVLGRPIADWPPRALRRAVGWVPQRPVLSEGTARDQLALPARLGVVAAGDAAARARDAARIAGVADELLARPVSVLSGGERTRVAIARALVLDPRVLALDEPTSGLDGASAAALLARLDQWRRTRGAALVVVTHRLADVRALGGQLLLVDGGGVALAGDTAAVLESAGGARLRALLAGDS